MSERLFVEEIPRIGLDVLRTLQPQLTDGAELAIEVEIEGQTLLQRVELSSTLLPRRGGKRWWWVCPSCGRRSGYLYITERLQCRRCAGAEYACSYVA